MDPIKLNLLDDQELLQNKGDAVAYLNTEKNLIQLVIICPGCGQESASAGSHSFNKETLSYTPSIVHNPKLGGCGWHGFLTNGWFTEC